MKTELPTGNLIRLRSAMYSNDAIDPQNESNSGLKGLTSLVGFTGIKILRWARIRGKTNILA
jgi:hypothetical protein